jgi:hypothetical protein
VYVLCNMVEAVRHGGLVLDLQVIRPNPVVEADGATICELDGTPLFVKADAARAAVDALVASGELVQEKVDDHDVCKHYVNGAELLDDWARTERRPLGDGEPRVRAVTQPCATRERCRLRRLRVVR